ncbi:MAG: TolC family protein [Planctomycetota bacterium]
MLLKIHKHWRLVLAQVAFCSGCITVGDRATETKDPFLEATRLAQRQETAVGVSSASTVVPVLTPLPAVIKAGEAPDDRQPVKLMAFEQDRASEPDAELVIPRPTPVEPIPAADGRSLAPNSMPAVLEAGVYPIDLANALGLGGADNLQVRLARTRLFQAQARHLQAKTLWLPSIRLGLGYNKHDGRLQETQGNVIEVERNSLFFGGGLGLGNAPLPAGAGGPPRMFVNLSLADAYFKPLAACQVVAAHGAAERAATNDSLASIAMGYHSLLEAHGRLANATAASEMAGDMVKLVEDFEQEGFSSQTEVSRARTAHARWRRAVADAQRATVTTSARLARILRLPPQVQLAPVEEFLMPIEFVDGEADLNSMIGQAWRSRPEISQLVAQREAACFRVQEEKWRPWIPNVYAGTSYGGFGGGTSTDFSSASDRSDVDLVAVWELENLGAGNVAKQKLRRGELHEQVLQIEALRERIAAEVVEAAADVASFRQQMEIAQSAIADAEQSYRLNEQRIREDEGLPIELLQSITALAEARDAYTEAVANYNRAQYRLLRAVGTPAGVPAVEAAA